MILSDREIDAAIDQKRIVIDPKPDAAMINSTSVDLRLHGILDQWEFPAVDPGLGQKPQQFCPGDKGFKFAALEKKFTREIRIPPEGYPLPPSFLSTSVTGPVHFILGWTYEKIYLPHSSRLCARVEGKSSLGRMGLGVHVTAPTIHAGFGHNETDPDAHGARLRLEIWNVGPLPIVLAPDIRVCQLIIEEVREVPVSGYRGIFNQQGPAPKTA